MKKENRQNIDLRMDEFFSLLDPDKDKKRKKIPKIKICGITTQEEITYLNEMPIAYAGFVFCEKSKRNVSLKEAEFLGKTLNQKIKKIAVFMEPDKKIIEQLPYIGFDGVQIHRPYNEVLPSSLFLWQAMSYPLKNTKEEIEQRILEQIKQEKEKHEQLTGILFDAKTPGAGKTFDWNNALDFSLLKEKVSEKEKDIRFILAGGLDATNVQKGISFFHPDVLDVSSGVEGISGKKDRQKIIDFVRKVTSYE